MPADPITTLTNRRVLNAILDKTIKPYTALTKLLFPPATKENLFEEFAQVDVLEGTYPMAPFVKVGQKPVIVGTLNGTSYTIETPYINIERPLQWSTKFAKRQAGQPVFSSNPSVIIDMVRRAIERDATFMNTLIDDRIEWMAAFILRGQVEYSVEGKASFTISTGKPSANTFTVSALWDAGSAKPLSDITDVKLIVSARRGPPPTVGICGAEAGDAIRDMLETKQITALQTTSGIDTGKATFRKQVQEDGMMFICELGGVDFFQYTGIFEPDDGGASEPFIRTDYIEFFSTSPRAQAMRSLSFGMIPSLKAIMEGTAVTERYLVSIPPTERVDVYSGIIKSRPFPWFSRPDWSVSMKVV